MTLLWVNPSRGEAETLRILIRDYQNNLEVMRAVADAFEAESDHSIEFVPVKGDDYYLKDIAQSHLSSPQSEIDLVEVNSVWVPTLAQYFADLTQHEFEALTELLPSLLVHVEEQAVIGGSHPVYGYPYRFSVSLLYYRSDLLEKYNFAPPKTWQEVEKISRTIMFHEQENNPDLWGFIFSTANPGDLFGFMIEVINGHKGGKIIEDYGVVSVDNLEAVEAVKHIKEWIGDIQPPEILTLTNEKKLQFWQEGRAIFMRHGSSGFSSTQDDDTSGSSELKHPFGVTPIPSFFEDTSAAPEISIRAFALSKTSEKMSASLDFLRFIHEAPTQLRIMNMSGWLPSRLSVLQEALDKYQPISLYSAIGSLSQFRYTFLNPSALPGHIVGANYQKVLDEVFISFSHTLRGSGTIENNIRKLSRRLEKIKANQGEGQLIGVLRPRLTLW